MTDNSDMNEKLPNTDGFWIVYPMIVLAMIAIWIVNGTKRIWWWVK